MPEEHTSHKNWTGPLQTTLDGSGNGEVVFDSSVKPDKDILLEYLIVRVENTGSSIPFAFVFIGDDDASNIVDGTSSGDLDVSAYLPRLFVPGNKELRVRWEGGTAGAKATSRFQYHI